jgi:hypothetical protein
MKYALICPNIQRITYKSIDYELESKEFINCQNFKLSGFETKILIDEVNIRLFLSF